MRKLIELVLGFVFQVLPWFIIIFLLVSLVIGWSARYILEEDYTTWAQAISGIKWLTWLTIIWVMFSNELFYTQVEINRAEIYQHYITGSIFPKWPGFSWVGLLQYFSSEKQTEKHLDVKDSGDAEAKGPAGATGSDTMTYSWKVIWQVNIDENRTANMVKYVLTTDANINSSITLAAKMRVIQWLFARTGDEAKNSQEDCLNPSVFDNVCSEYGIRIIKCGLEDLDFSKTIQEARKGEREMEAFNAAVKVLTDASMDIAQAREIVKMKFFKNYSTYNITGNGGGSVILNPGTNV